MPGGITHSNKGSKGNAKRKKSRRKIHRIEDGSESHKSTMSILRNIKTWLGLKKSQGWLLPPPQSSENAQQPPPYGDIPSLQMDIRATDTPQWLWFAIQCQDWLTAVGISLFNFEPSVAEGLARRFEGTGTLIYNWFVFSILSDFSQFSLNSDEAETHFENRPPLEWMEMYGISRGASLYNLIYSVRQNEGAVPAYCSFWHWNNGHLPNNWDFGEPYEIPGRGTAYKVVEDESGY
ncbi:hypothetical protein DL98DRAFT_533269 [Cadophora sp. DSE1049]|nr:hypothetical protein DL98DRAFT_533269 [Cadophora sp. DSE1049]